MYSLSENPFWFWFIESIYYLEKVLSPLFQILSFYHWKFSFWGVSVWLTKGNQGYTFNAPTPPSLRQLIVGLWILTTHTFLNNFFMLQGWKPPFAVDIDAFRFTPRIQPLNELEVSSPTSLSLSFHTSFMVSVLGVIRSCAYQLYPITHTDRPATSWWADIAMFGFSWLLSFP